MAKITLTIAGRDYEVACRDGEEERLRHLGTLLDARAEEARRAVGGVNEVRQLLLAGLLMADELDTATPKPDDALAARLEALADRVEALAAGLEERSAAP